MNPDEGYLKIYKDKCFHWSTETELTASEISIHAITPQISQGASVCLLSPNSHHTNTGMAAWVAFKII